MLAIDVGFGRTKGMDGKQTIEIPSLISDFRELSFSGLDNKGETEKLAVSYNGRRYFVGDLAKRQGVPRSTLSPDRTIQDEGMVLLLTAMTLLSDNHSKLVVGLPVNDFERLRSQYRQVLKGQHKIQRLNLSGSVQKEHKFDIQEIKVLPQPYGAFLNQLLSDAGEINKNWYCSVGVIDIGHYTVDLAKIIEMDYIDQDSISFSDIGVSSVFSYLTKAIHQSHGVQILPENIETVVKRGKIKNQGKEVGVHHTVQSAIESTANLIVNRAQNTWQNFSDLDRILVTGGGSAIMGRTLQKLIPHQQVEVCESATHGNIKGFRKFAKKTWGGKR